jgi:peptide/nickel transport system permease protein
LTLNLGFAQSLLSDSGSRQVRNILLERLPSTLVLFGTANLLLFFSALFAGLSLSRRYGSFADKTVLAMAPTSAAPAWFYGLFLILIFAAVLKVLPFGGMVSAPPPDNRLDYALSLMRHMILPLAAWLMSSIFLTAYNWRTFFLIYSSEDYVEMAKAKGLSDRMIERRYILRPTLPNIITSFALLLITLWTGAIIFETVFNWPGIGKLYFEAISAFDTPVIVANVVLLPICWRLLSSCWTSFTHWSIRECVLAKGAGNNENHLGESAPDSPISHRCYRFDHYWTAADRLDCHANYHAV